jgi:3',5'-cyclic AMP phosphodiesterase CpdA
MAGKIEDESFFFIQMNDAQFGMYSANKDTSREIELLEKAVLHINRLKPAFVLNTGDLVNEPCDEKQLAEAMRIIKNLDKDIMIYSVPGNHDVADAPTEETLRWYRKQIGKDWYSFDYCRWHFIGLNSCIVANAEHAQQDAEKQWNWLSNDLERTASTSKSHIIIFMHHPLFLNDPDEANDYFNIPRKIRQTYLDLFRKYDIKLVLAGHLHQNNLTGNSQFEVVTTGPVGMPLGEAVSGFRIVKVYPDHVEHRYYGLDDVITLDF